MAVYKPSDLGMTVPKGGFQTGGWYQGRQYWNGTLSDPGQIHPESNQVGAGGVVSQEVIAQTNPANVAYVNQQRQQAGLTPAPATGVPAGQPAPQQAVQPVATPQTGMGVSMPSTPSVATPDLTKIYEDLYKTSGISDIESQLSEKTKSYNEAVAKIKDNPYLSEATMTGRLKKLDEKFNADALAIKNDITTKKADIETQLNLQTKQFDINSQAAETAFNQLKALLDMGALNDASGETIASLTRSSGVSSDLIYSAIQANKKKNVKTEIVKSEADDGTVTISVINPETGELIKQTNLGQIGNKQTGTVSTAKNTEAQFMSDASTIQGQQTSAGWVGQFPLLVAKYAPYMDLQQIYALYLKSDIGKKYGTPVESAKEIKEIYDTYSGKE